MNQFGSQIFKNLKIKLNHLNNLKANYYFLKFEDQIKHFNNLQTKLNHFK